MAEECVVSAIEDDFAVMRRIGKSLRWAIPSDEIAIRL